MILAEYWYFHYFLEWNFQKCLLVQYYFILRQIINRTWFPLLADKIAEPRPDMNIKVAAFTVSEKSINTSKIVWILVG